MEFLKGQVMMSIDVLMKCHKLVAIFDITEHILPSNSAENSLINYSISL